MRPRLLAPNLVDHFYTGGAKIAALRGIGTTSHRQPEEWIASTVSRAGGDNTGLASTIDGLLLRDLVVADPAAWRGPAPAWLDAADTGLLVKLLDAAQRLPVHVHPDRAFAQSHLGCRYGKTEAWYVLDAGPGAAVYLGWTQDVDSGEVARRRDDQDGDWMIGRMHRVEVRPGDGVLVPAGQVHAIGSDVFVTEVQEPTDFSIVLEWSVTTSGREDSHLDLGFGTAMKAVSLRRLGARKLDGLVRHLDPGTRAPEPVRCLPEQADPYFRLHLVAPTTPCRIEAGFAALVVLSGEGELDSGADTVPLAAGEVWAVPAAFGDWRATGDVSLLVARPGDGWPDELAGATS